MHPFVRFNGRTEEAAERLRRPRILRLQSFGLTNNIGKGPLTELREPFPNLFRDPVEIRHYHLRFALEPRAKFRILRGDSDGTGVEVALPRHYAADCDQRRGTESKFIGSQNRGDDYVAT